MDYREGLVTDERPLSLNPLVGATDQPVRDVGEMLYRRLLRLDDHATPVPDLATGYTVSQDGVSYHLPLRKGLLWSDGRPLTAADVVATVQWVQSPSFGDPATAAAWRGVHVRAQADGVSLDLAGPRASFAAQLTQLPVLPLGARTAADIAALPHTAATPMPTSGAYRVVSASTSAITLFPNQHAATPPQMTQVELDLFSTFTDASAAFRAGTVDGVVASDPVQRAELLAAGGVSHDITTFSFVDLLFNERGPILSDPAVRQAVAAAVDRRALVPGPLRGMGVAQVGAVPAGLAWAAPKGPVPSANPDAAMNTLAADGWTVQADGVRMQGLVRLSLRLAVADVVPLTDLGARVVSQLAAVGIEAHLVPIPANALRQLLVTGGDFDMAIAAWDAGPDPDVSTFWRSTAIPPAGLNVSGGAADPFLDQALDTLATVPDAAARVAAVGTVTSQIADDLPAVFLETPDVSLVVKPGLSLTIPPVGTSGARFDSIATWHRG